MFTVNWTENRKRALLILYKDNVRKWAKIGQKMRKLPGCVGLTNEKCRLKVRSLEDLYKRNTTANNKSGNGAVQIPTWLEDAFGTKDTESGGVPIQSATFSGNKVQGQQSPTANDTGKGATIQYRSSG
jgi:hypothetical protein